MANIKLENQNLIAPCGLYCGECEAFQDGRCGGCISRKGLCLKYSKICKIYDCCVNEKKFRFCNECDNFPCEKFKFFEDEEYDWFSEVIENQKMIRKIGIEKFLDLEVKRVKKLIKCAKEKGVKHCAECKDWPCEKLKRPPLTPA
jgi:hypothetical protein